MGAAHYVYRFFLAHELAHIRTGGSCGYQGPDALSREVACDSIAFQTLGRGLPEGQERIQSSPEATAASLEPSGENFAAETFL